MASEGPIPPELPPQSTHSSNPICDVCRQPLCDGQECLIINQCSHPFHRTCIETHLSTSAECPVCKRVCNLNELRTYSLAPKPPKASRASNFRGRGAVNKHYQTRSVTKNLFPDTLNSLNTQAEVLQTPRRDAEVSLNSSAASSHNLTQQSTNVDYNEINRMIENQLARYFRNFNLTQTATTPNAGQNPSNDSQNRAQNCNPNPPKDAFDLPNNFDYTRHGNPNFRGDFCSQGPQLGRFPRQYQTANFSPNGSAGVSSIGKDADKITSIINNWHLKFDGSSTGLGIDEFLYRVKTLTRETFNGDFSVICRNLNSLLTGKAREWY